MAKKRMKPTTKKAISESVMSIKWNIPDTIITRFASNMVVQIVEGYFKLSFFEVKPEIHLVSPTIPPTEVIADCVGSIIVPPDKLPAFIEVLNRQFQQYMAKQEELIQSAKGIAVPSESVQPS